MGSLGKEEIQEWVLTSKQEPVELKDNRLEAVYSFLDKKTIDELLAQLEFWDEFVNPIKEATATSYGFEIEKWMQTWLETTTLPPCPLTAFDEEVDATKGWIWYPYTDEELADFNVGDDDWEKIL